MLVVPQIASSFLLDALVASFVAAGASLRVRLFKSNTIPGPNTVLADLTEANFDAYAAATPTVAGGVFINSDGQAEQDWGMVQFLDGGAVTPNTVYGYYVTYHPAVGAESLLWAERFDSPVDMDAAGKVINVALQLAAISEF